uniref:Monodehydroascorbate reductase n=1 Tax=Tanacetum cinerariifolium TaxID=118510 RepID=A0A6L2JK46_TANCI|nr:hypothetical protein [Tanacetum cinerariifolium]
MLHIYPRLPGQSLVEPPFEKEILAFLRSLGHSGEIRRLTDVNINKLHQPWRSFAAIINKCLSEKSSGYDSLRLSQAQFLWGFYHMRNVYFAYLLWEDFVYQVEHKDTKKSNEMYYPRFTKVIIHHFMSKDPSIPRRNKVNWHSVRDYQIFTTIKLAQDCSLPPKAKQPGTTFKAKSLTALSEVAMTEAQQLKLATKRSLQQTHISQASVSSTDEGTGTIPGVPDVPTEESDEEISWKSSNGEENMGMNVGKEEGQEEEDKEDKLYRDVNINLGRELIRVIPICDKYADVQTSTSVAPLPMSAPTLTPSTIATINTTQQAPTPPTIALSTLLQDLPNFGSLYGFDHQLKTLEANFSKFMQTNLFARAVSSIPGIVQRYMDQQMNEEVKVAVQRWSLSLTKKIEGNKSIHRSNEHMNLYKALVEAYESDKIILDTYGERVMLKRRHDDDADKDEEPSAGSDRGSKRCRKGKEPESASAPREKATRSAGKSTQVSKSRQTSARKSATAEEPMQATFEMEEPSHPEFETGVDDQPIIEPSQHPEWFSQQKKPPTPDRDWNKTLPATHGSIQPWISELAKQSDSRSSFNELMDTPMDFFAFLMNRLKGISYWGHKRQQFYGFAVNRESARDVYSKHRFIIVIELKIVEWHNYKHLDWITVRRDDDKLYKFKEGDLKRLRIQDIEDMLLLPVQGKQKNLTDKERFDFNVSLRMFTRSILIQRRVEDIQLGVESYQKKLNLTRPDMYRSNLKRKEAYIAYSNPRGFIYQNKDKQNRLMRIDELHKFSDGKLTDVRTALDDRLKEIRMNYLPQLIWRKSDKDRAAAMI